MNPQPGDAPQTVGHYTLHGEIGGGGMATVHFGRVAGAIGFTRTVAIKRLHRDFVRDPEFVSMFMDEARVAARVRHPNVVQTIDVVLDNGEIFLVLEYVHGASLARLMKAAIAKQAVIPARIAAAITSGALHGLHAAHEAIDENGEPLDIVHRDVSPQNILVGSDGVTRVLDFGIAKAAGRTQITREGQIKGKLAYMSPEQVTGVNVTRRCDVFAATIVFWEMLAGRRLFRSETEGETIAMVMGAEIKRPSELRPELAPLDGVVLNGLARKQAERFQTARDMARELENAIKIASPLEVSEWVESLIGDELSELSTRIARLESGKEKGRRLTPSPDAVEPDAKSSIVTRRERPLPSNPAIDDAENTQEDEAPMLVAEAEPPPTSRRSWIAGIAFALCACIGMLALITKLSSARSDSSAPIASSSTMAAPVSASAILPATAAPADSAPSISVSALPRSLPEPTHAHHASAHDPQPAASHPNALPTPTGSAVPDCSEPKYVGDDGHTHFKPECYRSGQAAP